MKTLFSFLWILMLLTGTMAMLGSCSTSGKIQPSPQKNSMHEPIFNQDYLERISEKFRQGIDFAAIGHEPGWELDVFGLDSMILRKPSGERMKTGPVKKDKAMDAPVLRLAAESPQGNMIVTLQPDSCADLTTGIRHDYRVRISMPDYPRDRQLEWEGCGTWMFDARLQDIWVLESLDQKKWADLHIAGAEVPRLEFRIKDKQVSGTGGCNGFSGMAEVCGRMIRFGHFVSTLRACPDMSMEDALYKDFSLQELPYQIKHGTLTIISKNGRTWVWKKVD